MEFLSFFPEAFGDSLFFLYLLIARYIADGLYYAYTPDHQLTAYTNLLYIRGGVEDTRLEARPRTQKNFEAKDQGHRRKCSTKKKGLQKFFSGEKGIQTFFSGDLYLRKPKKVFADFSQGFSRFPTKF